MDKVGCNHIVVAGLLESPAFAEADFLSMHLEQHLHFGIERIGRLRPQWPSFASSVLAPLEIAAPDVESGAIVVYTREGRVIGGLDDYKAWAKAKYNVELEYDAERMAAITKALVERAETAISDNESQMFNARVDEVLQERAERIEKLTKVLQKHREVCETTETAIEDLGQYLKAIMPHIDAIYALHHFPPKEERQEEEEEVKEKPPHEEEEEEKRSNEEEEEDAVEKKSIEEEEEIKENENVEVNEEITQENEQIGKNNEEEEELKEKVVEEEEDNEPDPEALELQARLLENLKFPDLHLASEVAKKLDDADIGLQEFIDEIRAKADECEKQMKDEKFRWKKLETSMLDLKDKVTIAINMLKISVLSSEDLQIKAVQREIDNYENFTIPNVDQDVLEAAAIKFAASYSFA